MKIALVPTVAALGLLGMAMGGCEYRSTIYTLPRSSTTVVTAPGQNQPANRSPAEEGTGAIILNSFDANPTNVASKQDKITFTVNAYNSNRSPMEYSWSATKGTLSGTRGQTVFWTPQKSDGSLESGMATVQVLITDQNGATKQAAVNILIREDGSATMQQ